MIAIQVLHCLLIWYLWLCIILVSFYALLIFIKIKYRGRVRYKLGFLLDQSTQYTLAISASFVEYSLETYLSVPDSISFFLYFLGLGITIIGHLFRIGAQINAGTSFTHLIRTEKDEEHKLVTTGLYR